MSYFDLPDYTKKNKNIPKNRFYESANAKERKLFASQISKITWINMLATETTNLPYKNAKRINIFRLECKSDEQIITIAKVIDKATPFPVICLAYFQGYFKLITSLKHPHISQEDASVLDYTFSSDWHKADFPLFKLNLAKSLDEVHKDFCFQLIGGRKHDGISLQEIAEKLKTIESLEREINRLRNKVQQCKQFNKKVELNLQLRDKEKEFRMLMMFLEK
ncbi:MAG: hypothetical protein ACI85I_002794 [Arenicella sp.]|jgi:hypothetical protein